MNLPTVECLVCGRQNGTVDTICWNCGKPLVEVKPLCPGCGNPREWVTCMNPFHMDKDPLPPMSDIDLIAAARLVGPDNVRMLPRLDFLINDLADRLEQRLSNAEFHRERRDVFVECISDYERVRGYLHVRYNDNATQREISTWMAQHGYGLFVEGVPESEEWRSRYWPSPSEQADNQGQRLTDSEADEMMESQYEEALADGEPWAEDSYDHNHPEEAI